MPEEEPPSMEEIIEAYRGRYVAIAVTERDANGQPVRGRVLESYFDKYKLRDLVRGEKDVCIFYAGPAPQEGFVGVL